MYFEIQADDPARAIGFYSHVFGWDFTEQEGLPLKYWRISLRMRPFGARPPLKWRINARALTSPTTTSRRGFWPPVARVKMEPPAMPACRHYRPIRRGEEVA
jgi:hypothetical protein